MVIIGLTGSFGSGKSTVLQALADCGAVVLSADELAVEAVQPGTQGYQAIVKRFGTGILQENGDLDRKALAKIVFQDQRALADLNKITHGEIERLFQNEIEQLYRKNENTIVIYECPLLFEAGLEKQVQKIIVVSVDEETRKKRLAEFRNFSAAEVEARLKNQLPQKEKLKRADFLVDNSGSLAETLHQVRSIWAALQQLPQQSWLQLPVAEKTTLG